jgi:hypothetical protein
MNKMMQKILDWCKHHGAKLMACHLPGLDNNHTDCLSQLYPQHKWSLMDHIFTDLECHWGPHMVDCMVTAENACLCHFNSCFHEPGTEVVDALAQSWRYDNNWVAPLIVLILKIIALVWHQLAMATIVVPVWRGCQWFRDLMDLCIEPPV